MNSNINFKNLWIQQTASPPDANELLVKVRHLKMKHFRTLIVVNILLVATSVFIISIWVYYQPQFKTTKIGIIMAITAMVMYLSVYNRSIPLLKNDDIVQSTREYLNHLLSIKTQQQYLQTTILSAYFILLSIGLCLYLYEYTSRMSILMATLSYSITTAWIAFNWFYIRPRQIKKQQTKLDDIIEKFANLCKQLDE